LKARPCWSKRAVPRGKPRPGGGSSNGRTADSDSACLGSNPSPPAIQYPLNRVLVPGAEIGRHFGQMPAGKDPERRSRRSFSRLGTSGPGQVSRLQCSISETGINGTRGWLLSGTFRNRAPDDATFSVEKSGNVRLQGLVVAGFAKLKQRIFASITGNGGRHTGNFPCGIHEPVLARNIPQKEKRRRRSSQKPHKMGTKKGKEKKGKESCFPFI
jgi:hypothetical protein